jgi:hypothetical protein
VLSGSGPNGESGYSSSVEYDGRSYYVQTQCSTRAAPIIESLVFQGGEVLVRVTSSYADVARQFGFTEDDGRHLLELQHADLVRKIRHGMLRDDGGSVPETARLLDTDGKVVDPGEIDDPSVQQLLQDLGVAIEDIVKPPAAEQGGRGSSSSPTATCRRRLPRLVVRIILPF